MKGRIQTRVFFLDPDPVQLSPVYSFFGQNWIIRSGFRIPIKFEDLKSGSGFVESRIKIRFFLDPDPANQDPAKKKMDKASWTSCTLKFSAHSGVYSILVSYDI